MLKRRPCRLQTVQTECYFFFFNLYLNFLVKFFTVTRWPVMGQGFQNTKWLAVLYILSKFRSPLNGKEHILKTRCYFYHRKVKITLYKKAFLFHHNVDKIMLKCISAPAYRLFPPIFHGGRMKGQDVMTSNVTCHAMLWIENSNEHPKTRDKQEQNIEIPQNRLV